MALLVEVGGAEGQRSRTTSNGTGFVLVAPRSRVGRRCRRDDRLTSPGRAFVGPVGTQQAPCPVRHDESWKTRRSVGFGWRAGCARLQGCDRLRPRHDRDPDTRGQTPRAHLPAPAWLSPRGAELETSPHPTGVRTLSLVVVDHDLERVRPLDSDRRRSPFEPIDGTPGE